MVFEERQCDPRRRSCRTCLMEMLSHGQELHEDDDDAYATQEYNNTTRISTTSLMSPKFIETFQLERLVYPGAPHQILGMDAALKVGKQQADDAIKAVGDAFKAA
ncbi:hypothetical protein C8R48DRAFT_792295 [Suillus tomentosus]|nr:hypothetical protein C8R48DRAFT_792295 [Suillus tomentosus]